MIVRNASLRFIIFSDGTDEKLSKLTALDYVRRVFFGNALANIVAMSRCKAIIGSDSSFSTWAKFLGQRPFIVRKMHFGDVLLDTDKQFYFDQRDDFEVYLSSMNL